MKFSFHTPVDAIVGGLNQHAETVHRVTRTLLQSAALIVCNLLLLAPPGSAHEIPNDVVIKSFMKPEGQELKLLMRVPMSAMRDVTFPIYGPGYLDIANADETLRDAAEIWLANFIDIYEEDELLSEWQIAGVRVSLPSDRSFTDFGRALALISSPRLENSQELYREQALLDVFIRYPIKSDQARFSIQPELSRLGLSTTTILRFLPPNKSERIFELSGNPGLVDLDPRWHNAFFRFTSVGIAHILDGIDHLLFVLCLIIPFRRLRPLIVIVTSFTVAHSITLLSSAFGFVPDVGWFPPLIETLIAASIVYMAIENIVGSHWERRWLVAFGFGLVHGFGFSFALSQTLQFAGSHLLTSLLAFNLGVEIGQIFVILLALPVINFIFRNPRAEKFGTIILSALLAHSGWHWMTERAGELGQYSFGWPVSGLSFLASTMRGLMFALIVGLVLWAMHSVYKRLLVQDGPKN
jgi:hypothetical protein